MFHSRNELAKEQMDLEDRWIENTQSEGQRKNWNEKKIQKTKPQRNVGHLQTHQNTYNGDPRKTGKEKGA